MHQSVRDGLEEYLADTGSLSEEFKAHLKACRECAEELRGLRRQALLVRALRPAEAAEPAPGFYARVVERIERRVRPSIWAALLEPSFGRRVAMASAALALAVSAYIVSTEPFRVTPPLANALAIQTLTRQDTPATVAQDRDVVLASLASFQEN